jgi:hypothetical protein
LGKVEDLLGPQNVSTYGSPAVSEMAASLPRPLCASDVTDRCYGCGEADELFDCAACAGAEGSMCLCDSCYMVHRAEQHFEDEPPWTLDNGERVVGQRGNDERKAVALLVIFAPWQTVDGLCQALDRHRQQELDVLRIDESDRLPLVSQRLEELSPKWVVCSQSQGGAERWSATAKLLSLFRSRYGAKP